VTDDCAMIDTTCMTDGVWRNAQAQTELEMSDRETSPEEDDPAVSEEFPPLTYTAAVSSRIRLVRPPRALKDNWRS